MMSVIYHSLSVLWTYNSQHDLCHSLILDVIYITTPVTYPSNATRSLTLRVGVARGPSEHEAMHDRLILSAESVINRRA